MSDKTHQSDTLANRETRVAGRNCFETINVNVLKYPSPISFTLISADLMCTHTINQIFVQLVTVKKTNIVCIALYSLKQSNILEHGLNTYMCVTMPDMVLFILDHEYY